MADPAILVKAYLICFLFITFVIGMIYIVYGFYLLLYKLKEIEETES